MLQQYLLYILVLTSLFKNEIFIHIFRGLPGTPTFGSIFCGFFPGGNGGHR
jgi:hypothetical protein